MIEAGSIAERVRAARRVYLVGNGGSYANAMHIANDLISVGVRAYVPDPSTLTAMGNDFGYDKAFSRWLHVMGEAGDLLIALSGSGTSPNVVSAMETAGALGMDAILVTNYLLQMDMQKSEEAQVALGHELRRLLSS